MAAPAWKVPAWKVYRGREYVAACKYVEDAAVLAAAFGAGSSIRWEHSSAWTVWREGAESQSAGESYDHVASVANARLAELQRRSLDRSRSKSNQSDRGSMPVEFTESRRGYKARERWAERYEECDGAPESDDDR